MAEEPELDNKAIKVLSSDKKKEILKQLGKRRMTLSEISVATGLSVSTAKEHLDNIRSAGLVEQKDEGRKWKYYELTKKGRYITNPAGTKVFIVIGISIIVALLSLGSIFNRFAVASKELGNLMVAEPATQPLPLLEIAILAISILVIILSAFILLRRRRSWFRFRL